jgi:methylmalonic aciduria homocystinuria type C protein
VTHDATAVAAQVAKRCRESGLDLVRAFAPAWYDAVVEPSLRLPGLGRANPLGLIVGNTRAMWPHFVAALRADPAWAETRDPLDDWVARVVQDAVAAVGVRFEVRFAPEPPPRRVALQRLAHVAGLAYLSPSGMCVHPIYGPWISLRAAIVLDVPGPRGRAPALARPCPACDRDCQPRLADAVAGAGLWPWLAVRDACPVGRGHRFGDDQLRWHYGQGRGVLRGLLCGG